MVFVPETGEYTVTETEPPSGYELADPNTQTIEVTESNKFNNPAVVEFRNKKSDNPPEGETTTEIRSAS